MNKNLKDPQELDLTKQRLAWCTQKTWRRRQDAVYWVDMQFAQRKDWSSITQDRTRSSSVIHVQLIVSRPRLWWNLKKLSTRRYVCHLNHHRKFLTKILGCVIWIRMSLEAGKIPNESNQNPNPNCHVREIRMWRERGNRETYRVRSWHSQLRETWWSHRLNKYGVIRMWTRIHKALRFDT